MAKWELFQDAEVAHYPQIHINDRIKTIWVIPMKKHLTKFSQNCHDKKSQQSGFGGNIYKRPIANLIL